jgi:hypothetical protein
MQVHVAGVLPQTGEQPRAHLELVNLEGVDRRQLRHHDRRAGVAAPHRRARKGVEIVIEGHVDACRRRLVALKEHPDRELHAGFRRGVGWLGWIQGAEQGRRLPAAKGRRRASGKGRSRRSEVEAKIKGWRWEKGRRSTVGVAMRVGWGSAGQIWSAQFPGRAAVRTPPHPAAYLLTLGHHLH